MRTAVVSTWCQWIVRLIGVGSTSASVYVAAAALKTSIVHHVYVSLFISFPLWFYKTIKLQSSKEMKLSFVQPNISISFLGPVATAAPSRSRHI